MNFFIPFKQKCASVSIHAVHVKKEGCEVSFYSETIAMNEHTFNSRLFLMLLLPGVGVGVLNFTMLLAW